MDKHTTSNPDEIWARTALATLIKTCTDRALHVLSWAGEIQDDWEWL